MERDMLTCALLFDTYGDMLTEKQRLCCDLRYNQDLSLGRAEAQMQELEEKIGAVRRNLQIEAAVEELNAAARAAGALGAEAREVTEHIKRALSYMEEGTYGL